MQTLDSFKIYTIKFDDIKMVAEMYPPEIKENKNINEPSSDYANLARPRLQIICFNGNSFYHDLPINVRSHLIELFRQSGVTVVTVKTYMEYVTKYLPLTFKMLHNKR
jgi:hypothetical protein